MNGRILKGTNNSFTVKCADGKSRLCGIKGKKLKDCEGYYNPLAAGDVVELEKDVHDDGAGLITGLVPRKKRLYQAEPKT